MSIFDHCNMKDNPSCQNMTESKVYCTECKPRSETADDIQKYNKKYNKNHVMKSWKISILHNKLLRTACQLIICKISE